MRAEESRSALKMQVGEIVFTGVEHFGPDDLLSCISLSAKATFTTDLATSDCTLGQTAAQKATNPDVKNFGNRMVNDHGKAGDELKQLATNKGLALPTDLNAEDKKIADELSSRSGKDFEKAYIKDMVEDHEKDVKEFEKASKEAQDPDLKSWASKTLPVIQDHLKMAKQIAAKLK